MIAPLLMSLAVVTNTPRIAVYVDAGARNVGAYRLLEITTRAPEVESFPVDAAMIRAGVLENTDVLIVPGGSSNLESKTLGEEGRQAIRDFVAKGGGYFGVCAGAYLALESSPTHPEMLHLAPFNSPTTTGTAMLMLRVTARGEALLGVKKGRHEVRFSEGPAMTPSLPVEEADFEILATYDSNVNPDGDPPQPTYAGTAAIIAGTYGKGRVVACAVHPEYTWSGRAFVLGALKFLTGRDLHPAWPQHKRGAKTIALDVRQNFGVEFARELQEHFRTDDIELMPVNNESVAGYALYHVDELMAPKGTDYVLPPIDPPPQPSNPALVRTAVYAGKGGGDYYICSRLARSTGFKVTVVDGDDIAKGCLKDYDFLIMPGGSCKGECAGMGPEGCTNLVNFIRGGGKYYGVCAGAFLASQVNDPAFPRLGFVAYRDENEPVYRGGCRCQLRVTEDGRAVFPKSAETRKVFYNGGPVFVPGDPVEDTDVKVLMTYDCDTISTKKPDPVMSMYGKGAILGGRVGKGKVFVCGPHPEGDFFADDIVDDGIEFLTGVRPNPALARRKPGLPVVRFRYAQEKAALDFYLNKLLPDRRFDVRGGASGYGLCHVDYLIISKVKGEELGSDVTDFLRRGGTVIVVADTPEEEKIVDEGLGRGVGEACRERLKVVHSHDEILPLLK